MNDSSEIEHGQFCMETALHDGPGLDQAKGALDDVCPGAWDLAVKLYFQVKGSYENDSYIFCLSEHGEGAVDEDKYGRLSMWRAYGGDTNVALVVNNTPFFSQSAAITAFTSPVLFQDADSFPLQLLTLADSIRQSKA